MATFNIPGQAIVANVLKASPGQALAAGVTSVTIRLADTNGLWATTPGNLTQWGVQKSDDGGASWAWFLFQTGVPFGTLGKDGGLPLLGMNSGAVVAAAGSQLRLAVLADAAVTLGATITTTP